MHIQSSLPFMCLFMLAISVVKCDQKMWTKNELKIIIEPGSRECFYQFVETQAVFHSSFQVIRGDGVGFEVIDPKGISLISMINDPSGSHQVQNAEVRGDYAICLDNTYSHLTSKLVSLYILTFQSQLMQAKMIEDRIINATHVAVQESTNKISMSIVEILTHQAMARFRNSRDEYTIETNNSLIVYWSVFQSILIVLCGSIQVYFVKRLFTTSTGGGRSGKQ